MRCLVPACTFTITVDCVDNSKLLKPISRWIISPQSKHHRGKMTIKGCSYLSMWIMWETRLCFMVDHPGQQSTGIVSLLGLRNRMRETMGHFSSKPLTTKYRQSTQETRKEPKAPLFPSSSASIPMTTDCLFNLGWLLLRIHSFTQKLAVSQLQTSATSPFLI